MMDLRQLLSFVTIAEERNFTRAAERLGIAQPPLSRQIHNLERELGIIVFDRAARPIALTQAGRLLFEYAQRLLGDAERLKEAVRDYAAGYRRRFVIGFVGSAIYNPIPDLIRQFRAAAPDVEVDLIEMNTTAQIVALKDGRIDAGLGRLSLDDPSISRKVLDHERLVVALPVNHPLARSDDPISLALLEREPLILYPREPRPSYADQVLGIFRDHDLQPKLFREVRELQTAIGLVAAEAGVTLVPSSVQRLQRSDVAYRPVAEKGAVSPIILSWRASDRSAAVELLIQLCASISADATT